MDTCCHEALNNEVIKEYDPQPKNKDGSIRRFLYRWDDGKNGVRRLVRCRCCGSFFLIQAYRLNRFSCHPNTVFEDWYAVENEPQADHLNRTYTGIQLEHIMTPAFRQEIKSEGRRL